MKKLKWYLKVLLGLLTFFLIVEVIAYVLAWPRKAAEAVPVGEGEGEKASARLAAETSSVQRKIAMLVPKGVYIVIDSATNTLYLKKGKQTLRQAVVSCGSGSILEEPGGKRTWVFDTPRGEFQVKSKIRNPDWVKPDWAFIEEGEDIPKNPQDRVEPGVLGDYALGFGAGYFIHGTLYTRLLGKPVTHGCIRVGDEDLKAIFQAASVGTKIFIL